MADLSILIPARREMFLARTIQDILQNAEGDTEIIAVLDGEWADPPVEDNPRVHLVYHPQSIGQRAATNEAARISTAKYIMKCDAHCAFDKGFDVKLMADCEYDWTVIPRMYNLHVFDWMCKSCGKRTYQGPKPEICECGGTELEMAMVWQPRWSRQSDFARFDHTLHFQYWGSYRERPGAEQDIADVMCFVGACWFMHRERYLELGGLDERHGSWGQVGVEMSCKTWLSGGRLVVNKKTWFAHLFRTQPGFSWPYPNPGTAVEKCRQYSQDLWYNNKWEGQIYPLSWLIEKFAPIPGWHDESGAEMLRLVNEAGRKFYASKGALKELEAKKREMAVAHIKGKTKGIIYYTDNRLDPAIMHACQRQMLKSGLPIVSVSLKPIEFGHNICLPLERGYLTMFKQILRGLEESDADIVFFCEHDILYHPSHFEFVPPASDVYYYNENCWKVDYRSGRAVFYYCKQTSGLCADRRFLLQHYRRRVAICEDNIARGMFVEKGGYTNRMGFEPGTHGRAERVDDYKAASWMSAFPNVDIRHSQNLTPSRWSPEQFRDKRNCRGWTEAEEIPGWGNGLALMRKVQEGKLL